MKRESALALFLGAALVAGGCRQQKSAQAPAASPSPATLGDDEKAVYALGAAMGAQASQQLAALRLTPAEIELFKKGLAASLAGQKAEYTLEQYGSRLQARAEAGAAAVAADAKQKGAAFLAQAAQQPGAVKTPSGLVFTTLRPGSGRSPKPTDAVQVNYRGTLIDGSEFDASAKHGGPVGFQLNGVIPCWTEGVGRMRIGEQARLVCPSEIAYGDRGQPPAIPPGATLVFEIELLNIQAAQAARGR
jgi:FKBP-type peptidyl-prolyl cis-trans isomerase FkpA